LTVLRQFQNEQSRVVELLQIGLVVDRPLLLARPRLAIEQLLSAAAFTASPLTRS
jgi:hypothetical protein